MEEEFVSWLRQQLPGHPCLLLGPGDDAAVLRMAGARCVATSDLLTEGVDFLLPDCDPRRVGRKALAVNLSDLAAMAARPVAVLVSLALPRSGGRELAVALYEGMLPLAEQFDVAIAGGDTNSWDGPLVISVTALGEPTELGVLRRDRAVPGDAVLVTGSFGGSILAKQFDFTPRVEEALWLHENYELHAGIDVSDGLSLDLSRLANSSGCGAALDLETIPIADDARRLAESQADGRSPLDHALADGEDFELILAVPPDEADQLIEQQPLDVPLTRIGQFVESPGLWSTRDDSSLTPLPPQGFLHEF